MTPLRETAYHAAIYRHGIPHRMEVRLSTRSLAGVILLVALLARLAAVGWWETRLPPGERFIFPDSESYWTLGHKIARAEPYAFGAHEAQVFRAPGYPLLLAGVFAIGGDSTPPAAVRVLGALLGVGTVAMVMLLAWLLFDRTAALAAAAIAAVYPGAVAISTVVLSEAAFMPLMLLQLVLWVLALRQEQRTPFITLALAAGVVAGLATLVRPSWLLFTPLSVVVAIACCRERGRQAMLGGHSCSWDSRWPCCPGGCATTTSRAVSCQRRSP